MWVWDLEAGWAVSVGSSSSQKQEQEQEQTYSRGGEEEGESADLLNVWGQPRASSPMGVGQMVVFDERRIVTSVLAGGVDIWRFDL